MTSYKVSAKSEKRATTKSSTRAQNARDVTDVLRLCETTQQHRIATTPFPPFIFKAEKIYKNSRFTNTGTVLNRTLWHTEKCN
jgi:hypothetical protein